MKLTLERLKEVLSYDKETGLFTRRLSSGGAVAGSVAGATDSYGYIQIKIDRKLYLAHRLAVFHETGVWPNDCVDHINGDRKDNRAKNLRVVSRKINAQNRRSACIDSKTGVLGVTRTKYGFSAAIWLDGKSLCLGTFATPEQAHSAYLDAKRILHAGATI